jgi:hypothetical protein
LPRGFAKGHCQEALAWKARGGEVVGVARMWLIASGAVNGKAPESESVQRVFAASRHARWGSRALPSCGLSTANL